MLCVLGFCRVTNSSLSTQVVPSHFQGKDLQTQKLCTSSGINKSRALTVVSVFLQYEVLHLCWFRTTMTKAGCNWTMSPEQYNIIRMGSLLQAINLHLLFVNRLQSILSQLFTQFTVYIAEASCQFAQQLLSIMRVLSNSEQKFYACKTWEEKFRCFLKHKYSVCIRHSGLAKSSKKCRIICFLHNLARANSLFSANIWRSHADEILMSSTSFVIHSGTLRNLRTRQLRC